jgi:hypothetical protein
MSNTKRKNSNKEFKEVNCESLQREINGEGNKLPPSPVIPVERKSNPYRIVGSARPSKTMQSLSIKIGSEPNARFFTILRSDIVKMFTDENELSVAYVREYDNPQNQPVIIRSNLK